MKHFRILYGALCAASIITGALAAAGGLNPRDNTHAVTSRPIEANGGAATRRWFSDSTRTVWYAQDANRLAAQIRNCWDTYGIADVEGDDTLLSQCIHAAVVAYAQPLDGDLTALAGLSTTGIPKRTGTNAWSQVTAPSGAIVGTTDTQPLTNKSIDGSEINSGTVAVANGGTAATDAPTARTNLKVEGTTLVGDADYTILATDKTIIQSVNLTSPRTYTLPARSSVNAGRELIVRGNGVNGGNSITVVAAGSDNLTGVSTTITENTGVLRIFATGAGNWGANLLQGAGSRAAPSGAIVGTTDTQPLTNKSIDSGEINSGVLGYARIPIGTSSSTVAAGDDSRITGAAQKASNLFDLSDSSLGRVNLGLASLSAGDAIFGVKRDASQKNMLVTTNGTHTITFNTTRTYVVGQAITISNGDGAGVNFSSTITVVNSTTSINTAAIPAATLAGVAEDVTWGSDDTVALGTAWDFARGFFDYNDQGSGFWMIVPQGGYYLSGTCVNWTDFGKFTGSKPITFTAYGATFYGAACAGVPVVDGLGSASMTIEGLAIEAGQHNSAAKIGLQLGRYATAATTNRGAQAAYNVLRDVKIDGVFSQSAFHLYAGEVFTCLNSVFKNENTAAGTYAATLDGYQHFPTTSAFQTQANPTDTLVSFDDYYSLGCTYINHGASTPPVWIGGARGLTLERGYIDAIGTSTYGVDLYGPNNINVKIGTHIEASPGLVGDIRLTGPGGPTTETVSGLEFNDSGVLASTCVVCLDAAHLSSATVESLWSSVRGAGGLTPAFFDNAANFTVHDGRLSIRGGITFTKPAVWDGRVCTPACQTDYPANQILEGGTAISSIYAPLASPVFTGKITVPQLSLTGNVSAPSWTTGGLRLVTDTSTMTDTTGSGTIANVYVNKLGGAVLAASSVETITSGYTLDIEPPTAGTNVTCTSCVALRLGGALTMAGNIISGVGAETSTNASGFQLANAAASATVPTFIPNKGSTTSGVGASASGAVDLIAGGTDIFTVGTGSHAYAPGFATSGSAQSGWLCYGTSNELFLDTAPCVTSPTFTGTETVPQLLLSGNVSAPAWTTSGLRLILDGSTMTDTTSSGTVANVYVNKFSGGVLAASSAETITAAYTLDIEPPTAGANVTCTSCVALRLGGALTMASNIISGAGTITAGTATSYQLTNTTPTATVPDLITNRGSTTTGIGGASGNLDLINGGTTNMEFTTGGAFLKIVTTGTNADTLCMATGGLIQIQASTCTISSQRFKDNILPFEGSALKAINFLKPVSFTMKKSVIGAHPADPNSASKQIGLLAENVAKVIPLCAIYERDMKTPKSYRPECVVAYLVKGMQEQQHEIDGLKRKLVAR